MTTTDPTTQPATPGEALPPILAEFWDALGKHKAYYERPDVPFPDPIFRIRTRPDMIFDDYFWDVFHRFPFHICHVAYYGPERSEQTCRSDGIFELRWVQSSQRPTVYALPSEPPESVVNLWDFGGARWLRSNTAGHWRLAQGQTTLPWGGLVAGFAPPVDHPAGRDGGRPVSTIEPGEWPDGSVYHCELRWRRPRINTYRAASRHWRTMLNRYPGCVIGAAVQLGSRVVGIRWGQPGRVYMVRPPAESWSCECHPNVRWSPSRLGAVHGMTAWDYSVPDSPTVHAEYGGLVHARRSHPTLEGCRDG